MRSVPRELIASCLVGWGVLLLSAPLFLFWFIHGSYDRYIWIIHGPYPFDSMGGGPFQLGMGLGLLWSGLFFLAGGAFLKTGRNIWGAMAAVVGSLPILAFLLSF